MQVRVSRETLATRFDAFARAINNPQFPAVLFQIMCPSPETGPNFQNRARRQTIANPRKNCAVPLRSGTAPRHRPFLACLFPIVFHGMTRSTAELLKHGWGRNRTADTWIFSPCVPRVKEPPKPRLHYVCITFR